MIVQELARDISRSFEHLADVHPRAAGVHVFQ